MKVRYTGRQPVSFMGLPWLGEVEPGAEFPVPDDVAASLLTRSDITAVEDDTDADEAAPEAETADTGKPRKSAASKTPPASAPAVTDQPTIA